MLSIIIPAHNEERRLGATLRALRLEFPGDELIVVANACTDGTSRLVSGLAANDPNLRLIDLPAKLGKGGSVRLGFHVATGDVVAFTDADGSTPPAELRRLVGYLDGADCVVASRWSKGAVILVHQPPLRRFLGRGFNFIVRLLFGLRIADTQCGAKVFRRAAVEEVIEEVETADFAFDVDLLVQLRKRGGLIREIPTVWQDCEGSTVNLAVAVPKMLASIVRLRLFHSPCRYLIPIFDMLFGVKAIKCRRTLRVLAVSRTDARSLDPQSFEGRFYRMLHDYRSDKRDVVWWTAEDGRSVAIDYLRLYRSRFDCVVEVSPTGALFWTPFFSFKPRLIVGPRSSRLRWPYADSEVLLRVPEDVNSLDVAIRRALTRRDAYFIQEEDGSWTYHPRQSAVWLSAAKAPSAPATVPASIQ